MVITVEQHVIGAMIHDSRCIPTVTEHCRPSDFGDLRLERLASRLIAMHQAGEPVDILSVNEKLNSWSINGVTHADLFEWSAAVNTSANVDFYAKQVAEGAARRELLKVAVRIQDGINDDPGMVSREASDALDALAKKYSSEAVQGYSFDELVGMDTAHDWLVPELLEHRDRLMLTGAEGLGKSIFLAQIAIGLAAGVHPLEHWRGVEPRRVLVLDAENSPRQWARRAQMFAKKVEGLDTGDRLKVFPLRKLDIMAGPDLAMLHREVDAHRPDVIVIGPLYRLTPRAIQTDDEATPLLAALDTLRDQGAALLIEAHAGKATGEGGQRNYAPRGSSALLGWPEFGFGLSPGQGSQHVNVVRWRGEREKRDWPKVMTRSTSSRGWPWLPAPEEFG